MVMVILSVKDTEIVRIIGITVTTVTKIKMVCITILNTGSLLCIVFFMFLTPLRLEKGVIFVEHIGNFVGAKHKDESQHRLNQTNRGTHSKVAIIG